MSNEDLSPDTLEALSSLGLTIYEARTYLSLLQKHPAYGNEISCRSGVPGPKIHGALERLLQKGMVALVGSDPATYEPLPYQEFLRIKRYEFSQAHDLLESCLSSLCTPIGENILWQLVGYDISMHKVKELIDGADNEVLASFSWSEGKGLMGNLAAAYLRGVNVTTVQFGPNYTDIDKVFRHVLVGSAVERHGSELFLVIDSETALFMGQTPGQDWNGYWTSNQGIVDLIVNYIRHDIYINKLLWRFSELINAEYGSSLETLLDILADSQREIDIDKARLESSWHG